MLVPWISDVFANSPADSVKKSLFQGTRRARLRAPAGLPPARDFGFAVPEFRASLRVSEDA
jgi:hypothetical protein